jgi:hypothetical protein
MFLLAAFLAAAAAVPPEIREHYRDHNFVSAFSSVGERRLVAQGGRPPASPRMARVAAAMARLADRVDDIDPGIMLRSSPSGTEGVLRGDLLRIASFEVDGATRQAWVHLEALRLDAPANATLVSKFDELGAPGRDIDVDELLTAAGRPPVATYETHRWRWIDGTWRRDRATRHLLVEPGR